MACRNQRRPCSRDHSWLDGVVFTARKAIVSLPRSLAAAPSSCDEHGEGCKEQPPKVGVAVHLRNVRRSSKSWRLRIRVTSKATSKSLINGICEQRGPAAQTWCARPGIGLASFRIRVSASHFAVSNKGRIFDEALPGILPSQKSAMLCTPTRTAFRPKFKSGRPF